MLHFMIMLRRAKLLVNIQHHPTRGSNLFLPFDFKYKPIILQRFNKRRFSKVNTFWSFCQIRRNILQRLRITLCSDWWKINCMSNRKISILRALYFAKTSWYVPVVQSFSVMASSNTSFVLVIITMIMLPAALQWGNLSGSNLPPKNYFTWALVATDDIGSTFFIRKNPMFSISLFFGG